MRLLDLPDEVLDLLVEGRLTEGHGRALLMAPDHADRRRLARAAADEGWTVRETEARAREAARPPEVAPQARCASSTRTSSSSPSASRTPSPAPSAPTSASPRARRATRSLCQWTHSPKPKPSRSGYHFAPQRAISSVG